MCHAIDHGGGGAVLIALAIDLQPHRQVLRVRHLVARGEPWADGAEGVARLALGPLALVLDLELALGDVVGDAVARDMIQRVRLRHVLGGLADDDTQFDLPVGLHRTARDDDVVVRADDGGACLHEDHGLAGYRVAGLRRMVGIVQADADELARARDAGAETRVAVHDRQAAHIDPVEDRKVGQQGRIDVCYMRREVTQLPLAVEDAWLLDARLSVSCQFHGASPSGLILMSPVHTGSARKTGISRGAFLR